MPPAASANRRSHEPAARKRRESIRRLKEAMAAQQVKVLYQPIVDARTGRSVSAEALLRWRDPAHNADPLAALVAAAEQSPVIYALERWAVGVCFADAAGWQREDLPDLRLNVNLSAREFDGPAFDKKLGRLLRSSGIDPRKVTLEITETSRLREPKDAAHVLEQLAERGFEIWLDDFGTGHSSLEWLWELPLHGLKIPGTFVSAVTDDRQAALITTAVIRLGHDLGLRIVAEGVETDEQRQWLVETGCDQLQGYLFSDALDPEGLRERRPTITG